MTRRHVDAKSAGPSKIVPYRQGESATARHSRRLRTALGYRVALESWCDDHGLDVEVKNDGHHWIFTLELDPKPELAEWWPSSAKLVVNKRWSEGIHVHDYQQVQAELVKRWGLEVSR